MAETPRSVSFTKAHAYGNDFLVVRDDEVRAVSDLASLVRQACDRHRGLGADGVMVVDDNGDRLATRLFNADGSPSELSGNGLRCVAACLSFERDFSPGAVITIGTGAGPKTLTFLGARDRCTTFRASMGLPEGVRRIELDVLGERVPVVLMHVGNPQCVVLEAPTDARLGSIAAALSVHPFFPEGTNVELAAVESPERVRILIWERGVGPTSASGTGACAAAVAAAAFGGASRRVDVVAPGGTQRVEWTADDLLLTGDAEVIGAMTLWLD